MTENQKKEKTVCARVPQKVYKELEKIRKKLDKDSITEVSMSDVNRLALTNLISNQDGLQEDKS